MAPKTAIAVNDNPPIERSLDDRIADAFSEPLASGPLASLLDEVKQFSASAKTASKEAEARALDPKLRPADVAEARATMQDADFNSKRMDIAAEQLATLLVNTRAAEEADAQRKARAAAMAERDEIARDLVAYEMHAKAIAELLTRLAINSAQVHPGESAEVAARGLSLEWALNPNDVHIALLPNVKLPKFKRDDDVYPYLWPLNRPV